VESGVGKDREELGVVPFFHVVVAYEEQFRSLAA